ncbi:hypothetical protein RchiOBHm_Chr2g0128921 [Rosa chinensis]|uniref:Uncharacterized protein n=1 Tax=Rosa chinensis TaxID=74649 RepID=A0A2P6RUG5_ROSCH|nr:hypothetical protein RchiOBHm_Chr2g0128921 [Rosa chinensis]
MLPHNLRFQISDLSPSPESQKHQLPSSIFKYRNRSKIGESELREKKSDFDRANYGSQLQMRRGR